jgi:xanthine dehydrogenase large subunit
MPYPASSPHEFAGTEPVTLSGRVPHESGGRHVAGNAEYIDDMREPDGLLHAALGLSGEAHARILEIDLSQVLAAPGVVGVVTSADIPGRNDMSAAGHGGDPLLADGVTAYHGQPLFAVIATTRNAARRATRLARIGYDSIPANIDVAAARANAGRLLAPGLRLERGDVEAGLAASPHRLAGSVTIGGQEHFYLEGQIALAIPGEDEVLIHVASQHPSDLQEVTARILGVPSHGVRVHVRRMGGGFGGKETQPAIFAAIAAVAAKKFERPIKLRPDRDDDMVITGKRHDFVVDYDIGFDDAGRILALDTVLHARCGHSEDLSRGVTDRAVMHADNAYYYPATRIEARLWQTNTVSNTAFRGYGGPQGIAAAERFVEDIAYTLGLDPLEVRKRNFYADPDRAHTPYHQHVHDNLLERIVGELEASSDYAARRQAILDFNARSPVIKRGLSLVPVKFGISFSKSAMNQGAALLSVYRDGSVHINHAGTEMGQGIHTKIAQVIAAELGIDLSRVRVTATATDKIPNGSPTAGSLGTDLNGMAAVDAARRLKSGIAALFAPDVPDRIAFANGRVSGPDIDLPWAEAVERAYQARIPLSVTGFYRTPGIHWNRQEGRGSPYLYFTYGASCSEVALDTLTGEYRVLRTDILQDVGHSINRDIDIGQIEGGFLQGLGWATAEELWWDSSGRLRTHAPSTYKIPLASDQPEIFNVRIAEWSVNAAPTVMRSKAVGEPPVMLALSVVGALGMAAASVADYALPPRLDLPATPERMLMAVERLRADASSRTVPARAAE